MTTSNLNGLVKQRIEKLYHQHVKSLLPTERLWLVELIAHDLAIHNDEVPEKQKRSIMELRGLGKEIWEGIDPQKYVDELRKEWERYEKA